MAKGDDLLISANEREFILKALQENELRVDGRGPFDARPVSYRFGPKDGVCEVTVGETRVLAVVSAKLEPPSGARSNEGTVTINVEFSPMASPNFEPGRPGEEASELAVVLERAIRETGAVDVESLCVLAGRRVWHVRCDVHVIDACGNIVGASSLAVNAALLSFRRPEATVSPDTQRVTVHPADVREPIPLALHHLPVAVTFGFFAEQDGLVVVDPTLSEEMVIGSHLTAVLNAHHELCAVQKGGGCAVAPAEIMRCLRIATQMTKELTDGLKQAHKAWEERRDKGRVRRHYGAEAAAASAVNPDFGLPGRGDHLKRNKTPEAQPGRARGEHTAGGGDGDVLEGEDDDVDDDDEDDEGDDDEGDVSDSDEDHAEEDEEMDEDDDEGDGHVAVGVMAPVGGDDSGSEEEEEEKEEEEEEEEETGTKSGGGTSTNKGAKGGKGGRGGTGDAGAMDEDDIFGMFDEAAKRSRAGEGGGGSGKKKKKKTSSSGWEDCLPGDGDSLEAAIKAKVDKKKGKKKK